jgi:hypothetical protein
MCMCVGGDFAGFNICFYIVALSDSVVFCFFFLFCKLYQIICRQTYSLSCKKNLLYYWPHAIKTYISYLVRTARFRKVYNNTHYRMRSLWLFVNYMHCWYSVLSIRLIGAHEFIPCSGVRVAQCFVFCVVLCRSLLILSSVFCSTTA